MARRSHPLGLPDGLGADRLSALEVAKEHEFLVEAAREGSKKPEQAAAFAKTYAGFLRRRGEDL